MKKLIAIAIVFALVAGAAFADTAISGTVETRFTLIDGVNNPEDARNPTTFGGIGTAYLQFSGSNADNTVGALWRFRNTDVVRSAAWWHRAFVWWRPIPQLRVFLGIDNDGMYSSGDALTDWAFHQGVEDYISIHHWDFWRMVFPGHWDGFGLSLSGYIPLPLSFLDNINVNVTIPTGGLNWPQATQGQVTNSILADHLYPGGLKVQSNFNFPEIGKLFITYDAPGAAQKTGEGADFREITPEEGNGGYMGISFLLEALRSFGVRLQPGVSFNLLGPDAPTKDITIGLGFHGVWGNFGLKVRGATVITTTTVKDSDDITEAFITANIMPWYKLSFMTVYCDIGMSILTKDAERTDADKADGFGWWLNPYVKIPLGGPALEGGLIVRTSNIGTGNTRDNVAYTAEDTEIPIRYAIPIRFVFSF